MRPPNKHERLISRLFPWRQATKHTNPRFQHSGGSGRDSYGGGCDPVVRRLRPGRTQTVTWSKLSGKTSKFSCPILGQSINRVRGADGIHSRTSTRNHIHSSGTVLVTRENRQLLQGCSDNMQPHQLPLDSVSWRLYLIKPQSSHIIQRMPPICLFSWTRLL